MTINFRRSPFVWRIMNRLSRHMVANYGSGTKFEKIVLVLTTTGRKSGLPRQTPLQYEEINGVYWVGSARGLVADWVRNIQADPSVTLQVQDRRFMGTAEIVTDVEAIADFLALRLERHPRMVGHMLRLEGLPRQPYRADLEALAVKIVAVRITPTESSETLTPPRD